MDTTTITVRIPRGLKRLVQGHANKRGYTLTGFVVRALEDALAPTSVVRSRAPGDIPDFAWCEHLRNGRPEHPKCPQCRMRRKMRRQERT